MEEEISPEEKREVQFETIMENFKDVVTSQNKMLPYEFASEIGVEDYIEEFYDYLAQKDKDGVIQLKGDEVKINKTKIMGALMLGDNSILESVMTRFRSWLMKIMG